MSYATKYRPRSLGRVVGNAGIVDVLRGLLKKDRIPGAIMFTGPSGCGKTTLARIIFRHLSCEKGSACGKCESCKRKDESDLIEVNAANARGIDEMRSVIEQARFKPQYSRKRVVILDEVHSATPQAQEALLKPLEDPPSDTLYILCTTDPSKVKVAIRNRCQVLPVTPVSKDETVEFLTKILASEEVEGIDEDALHSVHEQAGSSLRESVQLLESLVNYVQGCKTIPDSDAVLKFLSAFGGSGSSADNSTTAVVQAIYQGDYPAIHKIYLDCEDFNALVNGVIWLNSFLVDILVIKGGKHKNVWWTPQNKQLFAWVKGLDKKPSLEQVITVQTHLINLKQKLGFAGLADRHLVGAATFTLLKESGLLE